jgi:uncharacterized protein YuzE
MRIRYFRNTDTLYVEFRDVAAMTRDLDENTQIDLDEGGNLCALTLEHASERADLSRIDYQRH